MGTFTIAVLPGDGIGPEVMDGAEYVLNAVAERFGHNFQFQRGLVGGAAFDEYRTHFPPETEALCRRADAVLFGSVGGPVAAANEPKWKGCEVNSILALRKTFQFAVNLRPVSIVPELAHLSVLRDEIVSRGVDLVIVRELVGDVYFGEKSTNQVAGERVARDVGEYRESQIRVAAEAAFKLARSRRSKVTSVDKANVLETSRLWRAVVSEVSRDFPDVQLEHMLVDNCAMQLLSRPGDFDVVVTSNLFGDILSDEAAALVGSLGLLCSASLNSDGFALYEPPGGSAPDIAGTGKANPIGQIRAAALMLRNSFGLTAEADAMESAIRSVFRAGYRTADMKPSSTPVTTSQMASLIAAEVSRTAV